MPEIENPSITKYTIWIYRTMEWVQQGRFDLSQSPRVTLEKKSGDCEDFAILLKYLSETELSLEVQLYYYKRVETEYHVVVRYNDLLYDPTFGMVYELRY